MTLEQLKAELRAASPEVQEELLMMLRVLRRSGNPERARSLAEKLDDPSRWVTEVDAARRIGLGLIFSESSTAVEYFTSKCWKLPVRKNPKIDRQIGRSQVRRQN